MCRRWNTSLPDFRLTGRILLALALLLAPFSAQSPPAATMPICAADGGVRHVPDPLAPAGPAHALCDACLVVPPALPAMAPPLPLPQVAGLAWAAAASRRAPPLHLPPELARGPPLA
mgnify:CR=1 FL=1